MSSTTSPARRRSPNPGAVPAFQPWTEYPHHAVSKAAQDLLLAQAHRATGLSTVRMRPFVHSGPGRPPRFAESDFARQIAEIEAGRRPARLTVGNLEAVRDVCDVRDVVRAYRLAADPRHAGGRFNLCRGVGVTMAHVLDLLRSGSEVDLDIVVATERLRPADIPVLVGDPRHSRSILGWEAEISLERSLTDLLAWWRSRVAAAD